MAALEFKKIFSPEMLLYLVETAILLFLGYILGILHLFSNLINIIIIIIIAFPVFYLTHESKISEKFTERMNINVLPIKQSVKFCDKWTKTYMNTKMIETTGHDRQSRLINNIIISLLHQNGLQSLEYGGISVPTYNLEDYTSSDCPHINLIHYKEEFKSSYTNNRLNNELKGSFSVDEIIKFGKKHDLTMENNASIWIGGFNVDNDTPTFSYKEIGYFSKFLLNWMLDYKFMEYDNEPPRKFLIDNIENLADHRFSMLAIVPATIALEVCVITNDNKLVIKKRGSKNAVNRGLWEMGVSGGLDLKDLDKKDATNDEIIFRCGAKREMSYELGIGNVLSGSTNDDILELKLIGLTHSLSTNTFNFIYFCKTSLTYRQILDMHDKKKTPEEHWEGSLSKIDINDMKISDDINSYLANPHLLTDRFITCIYYLSKYLELEKKQQ